MSSTPPGWYPTDNGDRYWDGSAWTEHFRPRQQTGPVAPPPGYQPGYQQYSQPSGFAGPQFPPHQPKKSGARNVLLGVVVAAVLLMGGCVALVGLGADVSSESSSSSERVEARRGENKPRKGSETRDAEGESAPATWKTVTKLAGNTNKAGPDFSLQGCETRLLYSVKGTTSTLAAFYLQEASTKLMEDGGIPVASPTKSGQGQTTIRKDEGEYYLEVISANSDWTAEVQERC